jgi:hypothetical protein
MPVRSLAPLSPTDKMKKFYKDSCQFLSTCQSASNTELLKNIQKLFELKKPSKLLQDTFFIGLVTGELFRHLELSDSQKNFERSREMLKGILKFHYKESEISENNSLVKLCQSLVSEVSLLISKYLQSREKSTQVLYFISLLQMVPSLTKEILLQVLTKLESFPLPSNFFSIFLNESVPYLPAPLKPFTVVLDIDETLVHFKENKFLLRPGCHNMIKTLSMFVELVSFTSAEESYGTAALRVVDPFNAIKLRLFRQHMTLNEGVLVKDLNVLGRDLKKVVIIDDRRTNFRLQPGNGIKIDPWTGDPKDDQLGKLLTLILHVIKKFPSNLVEGLENMKEDPQVYRTLN